MRKTKTCLVTLCFLLVTLGAVWLVTSYDTRSYTAGVEDIEIVYQPRKDSTAAGSFTVSSKTNSEVSSALTNVSNLGPEHAKRKDADSPQKASNTVKIYANTFKPIDKSLTEPARLPHTQHVLTMKPPPYKVYDPRGKGAHTVIEWGCAAKAQPDPTSGAGEHQGTVLIL